VGTAQTEWSFPYLRQHAKDDKTVSLFIHVWHLFFRLFGKQKIPFTHQRLMRVQSPPSEPDFATLRFSACRPRTRGSPAMETRFVSLKRLEPSLWRWLTTVGAEWLACLRR